MHASLLNDIEETIVSTIETHTAYRPTREDFAKPLKHFGLTSVQGMLLIGELEDTYNIDVQHDFLLGSDTLAAFSQRIYELVKG